MRSRWISHSIHARSSRTVVAWAFLSFRMAEAFRYCGKHSCRARRWSFGCHVVHNICMAQIIGQIWQQTLHFSALPVPRDETVNREGMAQIMNPRLVGCVVNTMDADMRSDATEVSLEGGHINRPSVSADEKRRAAVL